MCCRIVVCVLCFCFYCVCLLLLLFATYWQQADFLFVFACVCVLCVPVRDVSCVLSKCACVCGLRLLSVVSVVWCRVLLLFSCFYWDKCELFFFLFALSRSFSFSLCSLFCCLCVLLQHNSCSFVSPMIFWFLRVACVRRPSPSRPAWLASCLCACLHCLPERDGEG